MLNRILTAFRMCLNTYTRIPLPPMERDEDLAGVSVAFLPAVGLVIGLLWWAIGALARWLLPGLLGAALVAAFPFMVTGFIHLQGFMRAGSALLNGRGEKKAEAGSFGACLLAVLVLLQFAACADMNKLFPLALIPVLSRVCAALAMLNGDPATEDEEKTPESLLRIEKYIAAGALVLMLLFSGWIGLLAGVAVLGAYALCMRWGVKTPGSDAAEMTGFALAVSELCGLIILAIV